MSGPQEVHRELHGALHRPDRDQGSSQGRTQGGSSQEPLTSRWLLVEDAADSEWTWRLDAAFLLSGWECVFGAGCGGTEGKPDVGCCTLGAPLDPDEVDRVNEAAYALPRDGFQHYDTLRASDPRPWWRRLLRPRRGAAYWRRDLKSYSTRVLTYEDGSTACIFANREGTGTPIGCALHAHALSIGENPADWKPVVCSVAPLIVETLPDERVYVLRSAEKSDWMDPDVEGWDWWCGSHAEAWQHPDPVYRRYADELAVCVENPETTGRIMATLDGASASDVPVAVRSKSR